MHRLAIPGAALVALCASGASGHALQPTPPNATPPDAARILKGIDRLSVVGRVLYVAAHPDDENTRLLSWLVDHQGVHAAYLSLTRGEGGQNLLGSEQAPLLGVIRTQELLAARGVDGAEQLFGEERDFGYSKTAEETLSIWGKDAALADVVWAIRKFQPDVIVTRFSPEDRQTHGHHRASAMLALEAFRVAADPTSFVDQLKYVRPWQARRIVWNKGLFGPQKPGATDGFVAMDIGEWDPVLGTSAGEVAARSRSMHKSQGFGASPTRGPLMEYFKVLAGEPIQHSFLDGDDLSWARVAGSEQLRVLLAKLRAQFDVQHPAASIPALLEVLDTMEALGDSPWKAEKIQEVKALIAECAGLYVDALAAEPSTVPGGDVKVTVTALNRSDVPWTLHSVALLGAEAAVDKAMTNNQPVSVERAVTLPATTPLSNPYWLVNDPSEGRWTVSDMTVAALPEAPPPLAAEVAFTVKRHLLTTTIPVTFTWNDPVLGERRRPLEVLPPVTLHPGEPLLMFPEAGAKELDVTARSSHGAVSGTIKPEVPTGFAIEPTEQPFSLDATGAEQTVAFRIRPGSPLVDETDSLSGVVQIKGTLAGGGALGRDVTRIEYAHIPIQTLVPAAQVKVVRFAMKRALSKVGYIPGAGDEVPAALRQAGYDVTVLNDEALASHPLSPYQAIVVGVRAFNTNPRFNRWHQKLMDYVAGGGTLLVQYNTQNFISRITGDIGPWPFNISQNRVTEQTAPVELKEPNSPVFRKPNRIASTDFDGWVQERGLYFADKWDDHYIPLLSMHDDKEPPRDGSLLIGHFGKGTFIYTGLAFFRQLPAGVPGAYRLFANLLSHER